jgi:CubicO group peptidase (beta-lactamase class C family)
MRRMSAAVMAVGLVAIAAAIPSTPARAEPDAELRDLVTRHVQPLLLPPGGMAVALTIDGRTEFFNFGMADTARKQAMTSDALFNRSTSLRSARCSPPPCWRRRSSAARSRSTTRWRNT